MLSRSLLRCAGAARPLGLAALISAAGGPSISAQAPQQIVRRAVTAMGGEQAFRALSNTTIDFHTAAFGLGQEETPLSPARATITTGRVVADYRGPRRAANQELRPVAGNPTRQRRVTAGGIGLIEANNAQTPDNPVGVAAMERSLRLQPERLLLAALDNARALSPLRPARWRGEVLDGVRYANGPDTLSLYFDRANGLLTVTEQVTDDPILGDRRTVVWFTRWQDAGGVKLPRQIDTEVNGRLAAHTVVTAATINSSLDESMFAIPDSISSKAQRGPAPPPSVTVNLVELAPGVWRAEGGTHFSLVVEQPTRLVVVEAPQTSARSRAVLDTLRSRFPQKRVGLAVMTHHHWDHSGGVREYVAQGIPIVAHRRNADFVRGVAAARKTVAPDGLTRRPRPATVQQLTDSLTLGSGESRVVIYELPSAHAEGIVAAYVPAHRLLFVADVLSPGPTLPALGSTEVSNLARARGITIDRVAGAHGGVANWADVARAAGR